MINEFEYKKLIKESFENLALLKRRLNSEEDFVSIIGAGISKAAGYKDWEELLFLLRDQVVEDEPEFCNYDNLIKNNPLQYAQIVKNKINPVEKYYKIITQQYDKKEKIKDIHENLCKIKVKSIITTNYDKHLERTLAFIKKTTDIDELFYLNFNSDKPSYLFTKYLRHFRKNRLANVILHIHGIVTDPQSIILSKDDYIHAYGTEENWTPHRRIIWGMMAFYTIIFFGFSLSDPYLLQLLENTCNDKWMWGEKDHFAIMGFNREKDNFEELKSKQREFLDKYGINVVFFDDSDDFKMLNDFVELLIYKKNVEDIKDEKDFKEAGRET